jgi:nitroreductase
MEKEKKLDFPINELSMKRWSPRAFDSKLVEKESLNRIFEAARWSPSAFNAQPWRFLVGFRGDENYSKILDSLVEFNQLWAAQAPVLILNCYQLHFSHNGELNNTAQYDLGQAVAHYSFEATNLGLFMHQMTGFDADKAGSACGLSDDIIAFSVTALGYKASPETLNDDFKKMELAKASRQSQSEFLLNEF